MSQKQQGKATWPQLSDHRHLNIHANAIALLNDAKQLKQVQEAVLHGPPKSVFHQFLNAAIELAKKITDVPSLDVVTKDLKKIKESIQNQSKQHIQLIKAVNVIEN
ncbi:hypothetical protein BDV29DRAFT_76488 [Aspergillus leporis]|uniref:Uncharacterized protein n=1 Tax=Aspergillus leporis TaxID=41062 RepID=A0A5N5WHQ3_9EURO|nr:hypothetical protein BDV29DRAFT_76488 [Aspergillus leporis]